MTQSIASLAVVMLATLHSGCHPVREPPRPLSMDSACPVTADIVAQLVREAPTRLVSTLGDAASVNACKDVLGRLTIDGEGWLRVAYDAIKLNAPTLALYVLARLSASSNVDLRISAMIEQLRVQEDAREYDMHALGLSHVSATSKDRGVVVGGGKMEHVAAAATSPPNVAFAADLTRRELIEIARSGVQPALRVIAELSSKRHRARHRELLAKVCDSTDLALIWPCLRAQSPLTFSALRRLLALPVLSYNDASELAKLDRDHLLPGLSCQDPRVAWIPTLGNLAQNRPFAGAEEPEIYYRLSSDARNSGPGLCFLEEAASACLRLVRKHQTCTVPYVVGEYLSARITQDRTVLFALLGRGENALHLNLIIREAPADVTFYTHLALAEGLLKIDPWNAKVAAERRGIKILEIAQWFSETHLERAFALWSTLSADVSFSDMLSPSLLTRLCSIGCRAGCPLLQPHLSEICAGN